MGAEELGNHYCCLSSSSATNSGCREMRSSGIQFSYMFIAQIFFCMCVHLSSTPTKVFSWFNNFESGARQQVVASTKKQRWLLSYSATRVVAEQALLPSSSATNLLGNNDSLPSNSATTLVAE
ncbi:hypothetical protein Fot_20852 [Forsythia ovata]|uniref:Uncharacterized protein n=1 Tax=Forsythia ovata TaxID=205694 RepID=A0ABD1UT57_9LAMI